MILTWYAAAATVFSTLIGAYWLRAVYGWPRQRWWTAVLWTFPGAFIANPLIKAPIARGSGLLRLMDGDGLPGRIAGAVAANALAPLVEEPWKFLPVIVCFFAGACRERRETLQLALIAGFGYGVGEIWYLARVLPMTPQFEAGHPFWHYSGFMGERIATTFVHALLTAIVADALLRRRFIRGALTVMAYHYLLNVPALLFQEGWLPSVFASLGVLGMFIVIFRHFQRIETRFIAAHTRADEDARPSVA